MAEAKPSIVTSAVMSKASQEYKERRRKQMIRFYAATFATLVSSRLVFRGVQTRKYIPTLFQANHIPPPFSKKQEALAAIGYGTLLSTTAFSMFIFGAAWVGDISSIKEFGRKMGDFFGGTENQKKVLAMGEDEESLKVQQELGKLVGEK